MIFEMVADKMDFSIELNENAYLKTRNHLDTMGFIQPMGLESLSLVQSLLHELLYLQKKVSPESITTQDEPSMKFTNYRTRMAYLLQKVCELNQLNLSLKQEKEDEIKIFKYKISQLEEINANYKYRESEITKTIQSLEKENQEKTKLLLKLEEINLKAVIQTPGGNKAQIPFKREKMVIDAFLQNSTFEPGRCANQVSTNSIDIFKVAEKQINHLSKKINESELKRNQLEQQIISLEEQIKKKDDCFQSLICNLQNDLSIDTSIPQTQAKHHPLKSQIDKNSLPNITNSLSSSLLEMNFNGVNMYSDAYLGRLVQQVGDLKTKYIDLKEYLKGLEKGKTISNLKILEKEAETMELIKELEKIGEQTTALRTSLQKSHDGDHGIEHVISDHDDQSSLAVFVDRATSTNDEKHSAKENEAKRDEEGEIKQDSKQDGHSSEKTSEHLIEGVEEEREVKPVKKTTEEQLREKGKELERITKLYRKNLESKSNLSFRINQLLKREKELLAELEKLHHKTFARTTGYSNAARESLRLKMEMVIGDLEKDRDHYREEYQYLFRHLENEGSKVPPKIVSKMGPGPISMKHIRFSSDLEPSPNTEDHFMYRTEEQMPPAGEKVKHSTAKKPDVDSTIEFSALEKVIKDKEDLQSLFATTSLELKQCKTLYDQALQTKTNLEQQIRQLESQLQSQSPRGKREFVYPIPAPTRSRENDIDDIRDQLSTADRRWQDLARENNSLRDLIKQNQDTYTSERGELEVQIADLIKMVELLNDDRNGLADKCSLLQSSLQSTETRLKKTESSIGVEKRNTQNLRSELAKVEETLTNETNNRIPVEELQKAHKLIRELDAKVQKVERERDQINRLCAAHKDDLEDKERTLVSLHGTLRTLENELSTAMMDLAEKKEELEGLRARMLQEKTAYERNRDAFVEENRLLRQDIATLTQEHKKLNSTLEAFRREESQHKEKAELQATQLTSVQEILKAKEQEKMGFVEQCKGLEKQIVALQKQRKADQAQISDLRVEMSSKDGQINELHDNLQELNVHFKENYTQRLDYERKQEQSTRAVQALETALQQKEAEISNLTRDLRSLQTACATLQETQESLEQRLKNKISDSEKLNAMLEEMKRDSESLKVELASRRQSLKTLEEVLSSARKREAQLQTANSKAEAKIERLKKDLSELKAKIRSSQSPSTDSGPSNYKVTVDSGITTSYDQVTGLQRKYNNPRVESGTQTLNLRKVPLQPTAPTSDLWWQTRRLGTPSSPENSTSNSER